MASTRNYAHGFNNFSCDHLLQNLTNKQNTSTVIDSKIGIRKRELSCFTSFELKFQWTNGFFMFVYQFEYNFIVNY